MAEFISGLVALFLTIFVLSYLIKDNILSRATLHIFIGVSAGYLAALVVKYVLIPLLLRPMISGSMGERISAYIALVLVFILLLKSIPAISGAATLPGARMVGVGAAVAIGGAVTGTLFPQTLAAINTFDLEAASARGTGAFSQFFVAIVATLSTASTLMYFQFTAKKQAEGTYKRDPITGILALIGKIFIAITFGAIFAGVLSAALTALIGRLDFILRFILSLLG